jgi:geranylgeranyl diphosphate synthase type II
MALILTKAAGPHGICGGQYLDLHGEGKALEIHELMEIHGLKTSALISASARIGVAAANGTPEQADAAEQYAHAVGLAFQVRDDMLDCTATEEELGKPIGSDRENDKTTFASLLGAGKCEEIINNETEKAIKALRGKFEDAGFLVWLAKMLAGRKY